MKLYLDTGIIEEIQHAVDIGLIDGVTTNPTLIMKSGRPFEQVIHEIATLLETTATDFTVSAEVTATTAQEMIAQGRELSSIHPHVLVKIPLIPEGLKAVRTLAQEGIRTNVTLCFSANQALLAAKAGAWCVSPFIGRLNDKGHNGMELVEEIRRIYDNYGYTTKILAASIRNALDVKTCALAGADLCTIPYKVYTQLFTHPLTDTGLEAFMNDWNTYKEQQQ